MPIPNTTKPPMLGAGQSASSAFLADKHPSTKSRLGTATQAQQSVQHMIWEQRHRISYWQEWKGMFDGNPPWPQSDRTTSSQRWRSNFNTLTGYGLLQSAAQPYYSLFADGAYMADVTLNNENPDVA